MKAKEIGTPKRELRGNKEHHPKNPRVPVFPPQTALLVNLLNGLIDAPETDPERRAAAYGLLTRVCVLWTPPSPVDWPKVKVDYVVETGLLHFDSELLRDAVAHMNFLFPNGEGLPPQEGCGAL